MQQKEVEGVITFEQNIDMSVNKAELQAESDTAC